MELNQKINSLLSLGQLFKSLADNDVSGLNQIQQEHLEKGRALIETVRHENAWFTADSVEQAFEAWGEALVEPKLSQWLKAYAEAKESKAVGVIMAGNIPLVGLHDALCVLLSGHRLHAKLSSKDASLMAFVLSVLQSLESEWKDKIKVSERLNEIDCLVATGSDNSARYFEYYFKDIQKIIRKNRTSLAILDGSESADDLKGLASDVFTHFGLGCRNVTKLYLTKDFDKDRLFEAFYAYRHYAEHNAYANNYDYNKAVYLLNKIDLLENGFLLLKEDEALQSPVGVLFYEQYEDQQELLKKLEEQADQIQCIVSKKEQHIPFGKAQQPELWDYADGVDTMAFLSEL